MEDLIPGVEIRVIKTLVPRGLGATGVLGIAGCTEINHDGVLRHVSSLQEFREVFGPGSVYSMPEVVQAFANGISEVVCASLSPEGLFRACALIPIRIDGKDSTLTVGARTPGRWGNDIEVRLKLKRPAETLDLEIYLVGAPRPIEVFRNLSCRADDQRFFYDVVNSREAGSGLICFTGLRSKGTIELLTTDDQRLKLGGGDEASPGAYTNAIDRLESEPAVDVIAASLRYLESEANARTMVYAAVVAHCDRMSRMARNRIGFGEIPERVGPRPDFEGAKKMASTLTSDRFVLVAPNGYLGATIGLTGSLPYFESLTFKTLSGVADLSFDFTDAELRYLLGNGVLPVDRVGRRGIAVVRGITTDAASQINVTRIADRAVRHVQNIAQDFIGLLNTATQRLALKQRIIEAFTTMELEGALTPSTEGKEPAFQVDVEASQADFKANRVRVHMKVRPVRAIDFIQATILVEA